MTIGKDRYQMRRNIMLWVVKKPLGRSDQRLVIAVDPI